MTALTFNQLLKNAQQVVDEELYPWEFAKILEVKEDIMILDIRESYEYRAMRIKNAHNVPRGILESSCDWGYDETVPELVKARDKK